MQLSSIIPTALCACATAALVYPWPLTGVPPDASTRAELTRADLLSRKDWKSTDVQVAGLYLGMSRHEAAVAAERNGFRLMQYGPPTYALRTCSDFYSCFLANSQGVSDDLHIQLGETGAVIEIDLDVRPAEYRGQILRELKGVTHRFFYDVYTDDLRMELFGPEDRRELVDGRFGSRFRDTSYIYAKRGIVITVSPRQPMTDPAPELETFSLVPPAGLGR